MPVLQRLCFQSVEQKDSPRICWAMLGLCGWYCSGGGSGKNSSVWHSTTST